MNRGFRETMDTILRKYGLKTRDCVGTVWADGDISWRILNSMGYRVEKGINQPDYDYVILSKGKSTLVNLLVALTRVKVGCIITFRADGLSIRDLQNLSKLTKTTLSFYSYDEFKILGVLFKGKEI